MTAAGTSAKLLPARGKSFLVLRRMALCVGVCLLVAGAAIKLSWPQQAVLGVLTVLLAYWMDRGSSSYLTTLTLIFVSMFSTVRYGMWRASTTLGVISTGQSASGWIDGLLMGALLAAEAFAFMTLSFGYLQTLWPLRRTPVALPENPDEWPSIDVLIPTFNEPLSIVRYTVLAAANIDWPADRLNVYLLDDGEREEFRLFAEEAGIGYMARGTNRDAKAGNINYALKHLSAPFVAIFDCDHVPTRSFLQMTVGWFLRDERLGALQTPQHLYSPDPFDRNLEQFRMIPNEGELFYGIVQDGSDFWNSTLYCGSCAVLRRSALDEIGGVPVETLTEDVHTSLRLQMSGWNTAYINIPQAAGLAAESLGSHVKQRVRWACGLIQVLRLENPLFAKGLSLAQRLCYFNSMAHFFYALPRLVFLLAPLIYLISGHVALPGFWAAILAYAVPHLALSSIANSRIQGQHRHSFWNEIYETILAPFLLIPTFVALLNPHSSRFEVAPKGGVVSRSYFDRKTALPFLAMIALEFAGMLFGAVRLLSHTSGASPALKQLLSVAADYGIDLGFNPPISQGVVVLNMAWAAFNLVILGVCTAVAWESRQRRATVRISMAVPVDVLLADGTIALGLTEDVSISGVALKIDPGYQVAAGDSVQLVFPALDGEALLPATVVAKTGALLRAHFDTLSVQEEEALTMVLYSRADTWLGWGETREIDRPLKSLGRILMLSLRGIWQTISAGWRRVQPAESSKLTTGMAQAGILFTVFVGLTAGAAQLGSLPPKPPHKPSAAVATPPPASVAGKKQLAPAVTAIPDKGPTVDSEDNVNFPSPMRPNDSTAPQPDLERLPLPFVESAARSNPAIPMVFLSKPSDQGLKAAGIVASWFGSKAKDESLQFRVSFGAIPAGNAVVIIENPSDFMSDLNLSATHGPAVAIRTNPGDIRGELLIIYGASGEEAVQAATGLALRQDLAGTEANMASIPAASPRVEGDSPRLSQKQGQNQRITLPDIGLFARSGFPFTKMADLSRTTIQLPGAAGAEEVELYLTLLGRFGVQTGYPATKVTVDSSANPSLDNRNDLLVIGTLGDQAAFGPFDHFLPVIVENGRLNSREASGIFAPVRHAWWKFKNWEMAHDPGLETVRGIPSAIIEEAEWPQGSGKSVVLVALRDGSAVQDFVTAYAAAPPSDKNGMPVSVLQDGRFTSYSVGTEVYHVGNLPAWEWVKMLIAEMPWIIVLLVIADAFAMSILARAMLRNHARSRLLTP